MSFSAIDFFWLCLRCAFTALGPWHLSAADAASQEEIIAVMQQDLLALLLPHLPCE